MKFIVSYVSPSDGSEKVWQGEGENETEVLDRFAAKGVSVNSIRPVVKEVHVVPAGSPAPKNVWTPLSESFRLFGGLAVILGSITFWGATMTSLSPVPINDYGSVICGYLFAGCSIIWGFGMIGVAYLNATVRLLLLAHEKQK